MPALLAMNDVLTRLSHLPNVIRLPELNFLEND
jgi:hypothetical protein